MEKRIIEVKGKKKKGSPVLMKVFLTQKTKCKLIAYKKKEKRERIANAGAKKEGKRKIEEKGQKKVDSPVLKIDLGRAGFASI
jgi:hypothetical protein